MSRDQIIGHDILKTRFTHVVERGRLGHAYLFTGPAGIGKRLFAREFAQALLCDSPSQTLVACESCPSCIQVKAGTHPDYHVVGLPEGANEIPVDDMRELCRMFTLKPARSRGKVAVLDDADFLNDESANCFLKTLEEPPPRSVFVLIGTDVERQMATIVSRCQVIRFAPLSTTQVVDVLQRQGLTDTEHAKRLAELSGGSPGAALALADSALWKFRKHLIGGLTVDQPNTVALAKEWMHFNEEAGKESAAQRRRARLVLRLLIQFLRSALAFRIGKVSQTSDADELTILERLPALVDADAIAAMIERCMEADFQFQRYVQTVLVVEGLLDGLGQIIGGEQPILWK